MRDMQPASLNTLLLQEAQVLNCTFHTVNS